MAHFLNVVLWGVIDLSLQLRSGYCLATQNLWNILIFQTRLWSFVMMINQFLSLGGYFHWFLCCETGALLAGKTMFWISKVPTLQAYIASMANSSLGHKLIQHQQGGPSFWTETFLYHTWKNFGWPIRVLFAVPVFHLGLSHVSQNVNPRVAWK